MARILLLIAGLCGVASVATAQSDPLDRIKSFRQVADQKAESTVKEAIKEAERTAVASPTVAIKNLKHVILSLDLSAEISAEKRRELVALAQAKIATLEGRTPAPTVDPKLTLRKEDLAKATEAYKLEAKDVKETVVEIGKLYDANQFGQAQAKIADLAKKYPHNPSVLALTAQGMASDRIAEAKLLAKEQDDRFTLALNDVARSALPPKGDIEFPKDWNERTERKRRLEPKLLGPEEEAILKALEQPVKTAMKDAPFEETVQVLSNLIDKPIYLDKQSLVDAGLDMRRPVSLPAGVTARTGLRAVLQSQGLTFVIKDKVIQVLTPDRAREKLVTRSYYLGDLISATGPFSGAVTWGPFVDFQQTQNNAKMIVDSITASVDPLSWEANKQGGISTIIFHYPSMSLIVRAPAEVHATLGGKLR